MMPYGESRKARMDSTLMATTTYANSARRMYLRLRSGISSARGSRKFRTREETRRRWRIFLVRARVVAAVSSNSDYEPFGGPGVKHSCLMQDEPESGFGFSRKMSLKRRNGILGVDPQHGRLGSHQP